MVADLQDIIVTQAEILARTGWSEETLATKIHREGFPRKISWSRKERRIFNRAKVNEFFNTPMDKDADGFKNA